jgi:hypothetical protein
MARNSLSTDTADMFSVRAAAVLTLFIGCGGPGAQHPSQQNPGSTGENAAPSTSGNLTSLRTAPEGAVFRPNFETAEGTVERATAFTVAATDRTPALLVTAHLVFGRDGGLHREYGWDELAIVVGGATARNPWDATLVVHAGPPRSACRRRRIAMDCPCASTWQEP